jgi:hypothetical protein
MKLFANVIGIVAALWAMLLVAPEVENKFFPVLTDFEIEQYWFDGKNVTLVATIRKVRNCEYVAPWRAKAVNSGRMLQIVHEDVDSPNWSKGEIQTQFTILNTGIESFELWSEHKCHVGWSVFSFLGEVK